MRKMLVAITINVLALAAGAAPRLWVLRSPGEIAVAAPARRESEIAEVKKAVAEADDAVRYWDAGAPNYRWQLLMQDLFTTSSTDVVNERVAAALHIAINDAVVAADHYAKQYRAKPPAVDALVAAPQFSYPSIHASAAGAAATVLAHLFPDKAAEIAAQAKKAARSRVAAGVAFPSDVEAGLALGREVGARVVERLKRDNSEKPWEGSIPGTPGTWTGKDPTLPQIATWKTWILRSPDALRPPPPPKFDDAAMKEVSDPQNTTGARKKAAFHWVITGLLGYFNEQAALGIFEERLDRDPVRAADIYATLNAAYYDALVAVWDAKFAYWGLRPFQYDPAFKPQVTTPNFPGYPSGHAIFAGTATAILAHYFPREAARYEKTAIEIANSRLWAGVHFRVDNEVGLDMGKKLAAKAIIAPR